MKRGSAMEGFIREDGTIRPIEHYDDTELTNKVDANTSSITDLEERVHTLEEHGGAEDLTKADKVENATAGNLASLDDEGNLQDSGESTESFAKASHTHAMLVALSSGQRPTIYASVWVYRNEETGNFIELMVRDGSENKSVVIGAANIPNLTRAIATPSSSPEDDTTKLITSKAVYDALQSKVSTYDSQIVINLVNDGFPIDDNVAQDLYHFINNTEPQKIYSTIVGLNKSSSNTLLTVPATAFWMVSSQNIVLKIMVGDYVFTAARPESGTAWEDGEFTVTKVSTFLGV